MKIKRLTIFLLCALTLAAATGCAPSPNEVIARVNGAPIYRWLYSVKLNEQIALIKSVTGTDLTDPKYAQNLEDTKNDVLNSLCMDEIALQKAKELGLDKLTDEEMANITRLYEENYEQTIEDFMRGSTTAQGSREKAVAEYNKQLKEKNLTEERVKESFVNQLILEKLFKDETEKAQPTEQEIKNYYDEQLKRQKESFTADPGAFGNETPVLQFYVPQGYARIKRILLPYDSATVAQLADITQKTNVQAEAILKSTISGDEAKQQAATTELDRLFALKESAFAAGKSSLQGKLDEIQQKLSSGTDFDALVRDYSVDKKMPSVGYYIASSCSSYDEAFKTAALALKTIGEVSAPVASESGVSIIKLEEFPTAGEQPLEGALRETIVSIIVGGRLPNTLTEIKTKWLESADVEILGKL